jgi:hypothetical protein
MLSKCHLSVYNYFCDKKYPGSSSIIDCLEDIKRSSGLIINFIVPPFAADSGNSLFGGAFRRSFSTFV